MPELVDESVHCGSCGKKNSLYFIVSTPIVAPSGGFVCWNTPKNMEQFF